ncbi:metal-sulfur cluster assembly factor [Lapidilactobacillus achengensis]|uniref:Metal-sulfur cluster assembly factor n=1 Tax=Lapidilactobacillus achengensis TaxID=2486000 RepID=A0ABW1UMV7_9LACO|nr:metal-sulfur cluster assembly factor [Lapidilactobacillus achengensis]
MQEKILGALETVIDPELGIDIVNLGLVYEVELDDDGLCSIKMTLTTMGCPLTDYLSEAIDTAVMKLPEVNDVAIDLVWYPQWTPEMMSRYARISLGIG